MRIDRLNLSNFRCFEQREFAFHPEFNLLVGINGTGKTTILDALSISLATWLLGFRSKLDKRGIEAGEPRLATLRLDGSWKLDGSQFADGRVRQNGDDGKPRFAEQYPVAISASGEVMETSLSWARSKESEGGRTRYGDAIDLVHLSKETDQTVRAGKPVTLPLIAYYGTMRLWQEPRKLKQASRISNPETITDKRKLTRFEGYRHSIDPRISVRNLISWFARQSWATFQQGSETESLRVVREAVLGCLEDGNDLYFDAKQGELMVNFKTQGVQPFVNLSDGQRCMLSLVADIAQKAEWLNPHLGDRFLLDTPGVVLIDELDLHLHPKWQRRVIEDLRRTFPKIQFVATTHSPFLIQSLRTGDELVMLEGQPLANLGNIGIEEIARGIMEVPRPDTSERYQTMKTAAHSYLELLEEAAGLPADKLEDYKQKLAEGIGPYADNPAFQAFLEMKRAVKLGE